ncbi:hypothetical protein CEUSTIGMA_g4530.t1 [Chlamydomonas eustigma]|uniref:Transport and Golgi organization protein 2 homolog n=1 Tax=Chlamydomonas eustigma TaxID=1157962 RepID=A0A250X1V7_9CHLO|nr:hypothetical protein CEUSTIGMA_g4530.t1 [Chlamydomonas eustigma]|eukprot:GAX77084.1 hypothetical protein CEUSTIGMA_g4530.t1 [Chlamydomonas eustigma]
MCISFFGLNAFQFSPSVRFLLAFGRDEFIERETLPSHEWSQTEPTIIAGRDMRGGGTWLGVSPNNARLAFLTNLKEHDPDPGQLAKRGVIHHKLSRGNLVTGFLSSRDAPEAYMSALDRYAFHGFNLIAVDLMQPRMAYCSNPLSQEELGCKLPINQSDKQGCKLPSNQSNTLRDDLRIGPMILTQGKIYGMSNGFLGEWRKVEAGIQDLRKVMEGEGFSASSEDAATLCHPQGEGLYGTRSQTVFVAWTDGSAELRERCLDTKTLTWTDIISHKFKISGNDDVPNGATSPN